MEMGFDEVCMDLFDETEVCAFVEVCDVVF